MLISIKMQTHRPCEGLKDVRMCGFSIFSTLKNIIQMGSFKGSIHLPGWSVVLSVIPVLS